MTRFWSKVNRTAGCWLWTGSIAANGYGKFRRAEGSTCAHRIAYELLVGPIPEGLELDHLCRVRHCVNPAHLEPVTRAENTRRGVGPRQAAERQRSRTHCKHGHQFTDDNTHIYRGNRVCLACRDRRNKNRYRKETA